jgi:prohibitin 2
VDSARESGMFGLRRWLVNRSGSAEQDPAERLRHAFDDVLNRKRKGPRAKGAKPGCVRNALIVVAAYILVRAAIIIIPAGHCGVVFSDVSGVQQRALEPGFNMVIPFVQHVTRYSTQTTPYEMTQREDQGAAHGDDRLTALTSDGQRIDLDLTITYSVPASNAWRLHQQIGPTFVERVIRPESRSVARMVCAQHPVTDYTSDKRGEVRQEIFDRLRTLFEQSYITLEDVSIREVEFTEEFRGAVEQKQQVLQDVEAMEYKIRETKTDAEKKIVDAQKDAAWILERGRQLERNPLVTQYEYVEKVAPNLRGILMTQDDVRKMTAGSRTGTGAVAATTPDVQGELDRLLQEALTESSPSEPAAATEGSEAR